MSLSGFSPMGGLAGGDWLAAWTWPAVLGGPVVICPLLVGELLAPDELLVNLLGSFQSIPSSGCFPALA